MKKIRWYDSPIALEATLRLAAVAVVILAICLLIWCGEAKAQDRESYYTWTGTCKECMRNEEFCTARWSLTGIRSAASMVSEWESYDLDEKGVYRAMYGQDVYQVYEDLIFGGDLSKYVGITLDIDIGTMTWWDAQSKVFITLTTVEGDTITVESQKIIFTKARQTEAFPCDELRSGGRLAASTPLPVIRGEISRYDGPPDGRVIFLARFDLQGEKPDEVLRMDVTGVTSSH